MGMIVLGIDPGLASTGYGLVSAEGQDLVAVAYGVVHTPSKVPTAKRLLALRRELAELIARYQPTVAAVEELFFSTNARTAIAVGEGRGVALLALAEAGLEIREYTPLQVKQAITGYGQADKKQMQQMVRILLGLHEVPHPDDAADALAIAICCHHSVRMDMLYESQAKVSP